MELVLCQDTEDLGRRAAATGANLIRQALAQNGSAAIIVATGASQFETLKSLILEAELDWTRVTVFHLDEYLGLTADHPASFRNFLNERLISHLPVKAFHAINGDADDPEAECNRLKDLIECESIDVAFIGIGENSHIAFNDPPADFATEQPYLIVNLDEACRQQQLKEGWFSSFEEIPTQAISMSVRQIIKSQNIICSVPDSRKAAAMKASIQGPVTPDVPASILQHHPDAIIFVDPAAAVGLTMAD